MQKERNEYTAEEIERLVKNSLPKSMLPLLPFLQPMMPNIIAEVLEIKRQGNERVTQKLENDSTLDAEEEKAKMKLRVVKKIKEVLVAKVPAIMSHVMVEMLNNPMKCSEAFSQINFSKMSESIQSLLSDVDGYVSRTAISTAKLEGDSERAAFLEHQYRNPESAESKLLNYATKGIYLQQVTAEGVKETIREKGAHQFITSILLETIYQEANRVRSEDKRIALETYITDDESNAYRVIGEYAEKLEGMVDVLNLHLLNSFFKRAEYAVHKALELDAEPQFNESRLLSRNRYFTKWSEEDHQKFMESRSVNVHGLF